MGPQAVNSEWSSLPANFYFLIWRVELKEEFDIYPLTSMTSPLLAVAETFFFSSLRSMVQTNFTFNGIFCAFIAPKATPSPSLDLVLIWDFFRKREDKKRVPVHALKIAIKFTVAEALSFSFASFEQRFCTGSLKFLWNHKNIAMNELICETTQPLIDYRIQSANIMHRNVCRRGAKCYEGNGLYNAATHPSVGLFSPAMMQNRSGHRSVCTSRPLHLLYCTVHARICICWNLWYVKMSSNVA